MTTSEPPHSRARWSEIAVKLRHEPRALQRFVSRKTFRLNETLGFHVVGNHFYEPIPDLRDIDRWWSDDAKPCHGVRIDVEGCESYLVDLLDAAPGFASVYEQGFVDANPSFTSLDAVALYCFLRRERPSTVVEVGQGWSTRVIVAALSDNHRAGIHEVSPRLVTIDPHPRIDPAALDTPIRIDTHRVPVQSATADVLAALAPGDLLFVDSSHVHKPGSDVETVFDVLIPGVPEGVFVHLHDIYTPYRYPRAWYSEAKRFWNEGEHLEDFLRFNDAFEVVLPVQMLIRQSSLLRDRWQREGRGPLEGSSFYLRRVSPPC